MWCEKDLEVKIKLRYYKEVINPNLYYQKYLFDLTSSKKKINSYDKNELSRAT